jgi:two-component system OmpR family sensor kinase
VAKVQLKTCSSLTAHGCRRLEDKPRQQASNDVASELDNLRREVEELRQSVRARDDFIVIAAHELRNPMTPIVGVAELALVAARKAEGTCPPRVMALLERLQDLVHDYIKRATRLLDISRVEAGNVELKPSAIDLSELVLAIAQRYEVAAAHQRCRLEHHIEQGIDGVWDTLAVEQVVENLLSNAIKFGQGEPVTVRLRSEGGMAVLEVRDRGIGMSPEQQGRIFGRFEQVMTHHDGSRFGVGLWVANRLAAAMNGRITVSSRPGEGSAFTVMFPLSSPDTD